MKQIRELSQQLADLEVAAKVVVDRVEDKGATEKSLLERLREAPLWISSFFSDISRDYLAYALGLVKSFLPSTNLALIGDGVAVGCSEEKFFEYVAEMKPIADKVISGLEPAPEAWTIVVIFFWLFCGCVSTGVLFNIEMYSTFFLS